MLSYMNSFWRYLHSAIPQQNCLVLGPLTAVPVETPQAIKVTRTVYVGNMAFCTREDGPWWG